MTFFSITYKGYTITLVDCRYRISGITYVDFLTIEAAQRYIDKLED